MLLVVARLLGVRDAVVGAVDWGSGFWILQTAVLFVAQPVEGVDLRPQLGLPGLLSRDGDALLFLPFGLELLGFRSLELLGSGFSFGQVVFLIFTVISLLDLSM